MLSPSGMHWCDVCSQLTLSMECIGHNTVFILHIVLCLKLVFERQQSPWLPDISRGIVGRDQPRKGTGLAETLSYHLIHGFSCLCQQNTVVDTDTRSPIERPRGGERTPIASITLLDASVAILATLRPVVANLDRIWLEVKLCF